MILGNLVLTALNTLISAGPKPVTIQLEGIACFALKEERKARLATWQVTSAVLSIEDEVPDYLLLLCQFMVSATSLGERLKFNSFIEFAHEYSATSPNELPPIRTINYWICQEHGSTYVPKYQPSLSKFYAELTRHFAEEEESDMIYLGEYDTNVVVLFIQSKWDDPTKPRRILDARDTVDAGYSNNTPLTRFKELM